MSDMAILNIGETQIPYSVRVSTKAIHMRIVVEPKGVEVVVPKGTPVADVEAYVQGKRRWVFDSVRELDAKLRRLLTQQYASGAKLQYRGRWLMLEVTEGAVDAVTIVCRSKFHVVVPAALDGLERLAAIGEAFEGWLRGRALSDLERMGARHERVLGVAAEEYRLSDAKSRWGSCGRDGIIRVHWRLVQAPMAAFEYVVAHEVAHLVDRNHGEGFWRTLSVTMPDWRERKGMLEAWEGEHRAL